MMYICPTYTFFAFIPDTQLNGKRVSKYGLLWMNMLLNMQFVLFYCWVLY